VTALSLPIITDRLTLRPYEADDLGFLRGMFGREDVCRYLPWPPMDLEQARAKLGQRLVQTRFQEDRDALVLLGIETATGAPVGEFMLRLTSRYSGQAEIGWSLHPDFHGLGLATEGARALLAVAFTGAGMHRVSAGCDPRNAASLRVMERLAMRREGVLVESELLKGEWVSEVVCAILETEWASSAS
jgi:RimJ/RimL family protein N-acetyltransferase